MAEPGFSNLNLEHRSINTEVPKLPDFMLPSFFSGELANSREVIEKGFNERNFSAGLLIGELFRLRLLLDGLAKDSDRLKSEGLLDDVLSDMSKHAYEFWKTCGMSPSECFQEAQKWSKVLNKEIDKSKRIIRIVSPGEVKHAASMNFRPGTPDNLVKEVNSWIVMREGGIIVKRANVV